MYPLEGLGEEKVVKKSGRRGNLGGKVRELATGTLPLFYQRQKTSKKGRVCKEYLSMFGQRGVPNGTRDHRPENIALFGAPDNKQKS